MPLILVTHETDTETKCEPTHNTSVPIFLTVPIIFASFLSYGNHTGQMKLVCQHFLHH